LIYLIILIRSYDTSIFDLLQILLGENQSIEIQSSREEPYVRFDGIFIILEEESNPSQKMKKVIILCAMVFLFSEAIAQVGEIEFREFVKDYHFAKSVNDEMIVKDVEGSPYLTRAYKHSRVYFKSIDKTLKSELRYNAYSGEFEFSQGEYRFEITNKEEIGSIVYDGNSFIYNLYRDNGGRLEQGFLVRMVHGSCSLYKRYRAEFHQAEPPATGYHDAKPARFEMEDPDYFLQCGESSVPEQVTTFRRGRFLERFGSLEKKLKGYIRSQKIRLNKEEDLVDFLRYYNENY